MLLRFIICTVKILNCMKIESFYQTVKYFLIYIKVCITFYLHKSDTYYFTLIYGFKIYRSTKHH